MKVLMLRTNRVDPDPRVEKEANALLKVDGVSPEILAWDRTSNYDSRREYLELPNGKVPITRIGIKAGWGVGMKANAAAFVKYVFESSKWMIKNRSKYDSMHACDLQTIFPVLIPWLIFKKKLVYDIYDYFSDTAHGSKLVRKLAKQFETFVINHADAVIICSDQRKQQIQPAKPKKLYIIENAPAKSQFIKVPECKGDILGTDGPFKMAYVGNLVEDRCITMILDAVERIPNLELHIGGVGALTDKVKHIAENSHQVHWYGQLKYEDVLWLEHECDFLIALYDPEVPNHRYAAPNKFYEALALGKPLVMFRNTGVDNIVKSNALGVIVENDLESLIAGIQKLISIKDQWPKISNRGKKLYEDAHTWEIMEQRFIELYRSL